MSRDRPLPIPATAREALRRQLRAHSAGVRPGPAAPLLRAAPLAGHRTTTHWTCPTWLEASCFPGGPLPASRARR